MHLGQWKCETDKLDSRVGHPGDSPLGGRQEAGAVVLVLGGRCQAERNDLFTFVLTS